MTRIHSFISTDLTNPQHRGQLGWLFFTTHSEFIMMDITRNGSIPATTGPEETFTGSVRVDTPFAGTDGATIMGAHVHFQPGARTAWHSHPKGQTLIVTHGLGRVQAEGGPVRNIRAGDVVWIRPNERHWHGAGETTAMSHIAVVETSDGVSADWMEKVSDADFLAQPAD